VRKRPNIVAVVPARDEAQRIARVVSTIPGLVATIVVVDDGSLDDTTAIARAADERVEVLRHQESRGVGAAIVAGYLRARALEADCTVVLAGDGQMDPRDLPALAAPVIEGSADYVQGNRLAWPGGAAAFPFDRLVGVVALAALTRFASGLDVYDAQCGFTAIGARALHAIDWADVWPGYGYPNDVLVRCARAGLRVAGVPVRPVYEGAPSRLRLHHVPRIVRLLLEARAFGSAAPALEGRPCPPSPST
jgi:dolichol-phosphate mannosyltransferase